MKIRHYLFCGEAQKKARAGFGLIHKGLSGPKFRQIRNARLDGKFYAHPDNAEIDCACLGAEYEEIEVSALLASGNLYQADAAAADGIREAMEHIDHICGLRGESWISVEEINTRLHHWAKILRSARASYRASWTRITDPTQIPAELSHITGRENEWGFPEYSQDAILEFIFVEG